MSIVNLWNSRASSQIDNFRLHVDSDAPGEREKKNEICSTRAFKFECKWLLTAHRAKFNRENRSVCSCERFDRLVGWSLARYIPNLNEHVEFTILVSHVTQLKFSFLLRIPISRTHRVRIFVLHVVVHTLSDVCQPLSPCAEYARRNDGHFAFWSQIVVIAVKIYKIPRGLSSSACQWPQMKAFLPNKMMRSTLTHDQCHSAPNNRFYREKYTWFGIAACRHRRFSHCRSSQKIIPTFETKEFMNLFFYVRAAHDVLCAECT